MTFFPRVTFSISILANIELGTIVKVPLPEERIFVDRNPIDSTRP